jgi:hypothetical protein
MAGLTVEDVNEMQDEMNKIGEDEPEVKTEEIAAKPEEVKAPVEEVKPEEKVKEDSGDKAKETDEIDVIRELKEQLRASTESLKKVSGDYQKLNKIMIDKGLITDEEVKASADEEAAAKASLQERQGKLTEMVTIMELNPSYEDVRNVCTQGNLDDVVEAFSRFYVKENGGNLQEVAAKMEQEIWAEANPYKKIYELVKKFHPKYASKDEGKDEAGKTKEAEEAAKKVAAEADKVKEKKAVDANPSAATIGTGGAGAGSTGWTAAKIDDLPEDQLGTVPKDIYDKYLKGSLK